MNESNPAQLLQQIAQIQRMEPGKLCVIGHGPNGPYYNLQCRENGKTVSRYVPADQVDAVTQNTENFKNFEDLVSQYADTIISQTRAERTAGVKKNSTPVCPRPRRGNRQVDGPFSGKSPKRINLNSAVEKNGKVIKSPFL